MNLYCGSEGNHPLMLAPATNQELGQQLEAAAQAARAAMDAADASSGADAASPPSSERQGSKQQRAQSGARGAVLPGLQDLRGQWSGNLQVEGCQSTYQPGT